MKHSTILRLLCALLSMKPEEIVSVTITNPIQPGDSMDDKNMILDVRVLLNNQEIINNFPIKTNTIITNVY